MTGLRAKTEIPPAAASWPASPPCLPAAYLYGCALFNGGRSDPFTLGVASGDPRPDGVVLWTRLAPDPLRRRRHAHRAGRGRWEVADRRRDAAGRAARHGGRRAASWRHSVHVEVDGPPARPLTTGTGSRAGDAGEPRSAARRTAPAAGRCRRPAALRLRLVPALRARATTPPIAHMADEDLDFVALPRRLHLRRRLATQRPVPPARQRRGRTRWPTTATATRCTRPIPTCRRRTPRFPGSSPGTTTRSTNDYADDCREHDDRLERFLARRAAAYQAY